MWGVVFGVVVLTSATGYRAAYPTASSRASLATTLGANPGLKALFGNPRRLDTIAGFTAWRGLGVLGVIGAVWGLLTATKLLRGDEDAGRWERLLAGPTDRRQATTAVAAGLGGALAALWVPTAALAMIASGTKGAGFSAVSALYLSICIVSPAGLFLAIGALCSQLGATRRQAAGLAAGFLGVAFAVRLVADSGGSLQWLRWATPLGWVENLHPLTGTDPAPLLLVAAAAAASVALATVLAGHRDLGGSILADPAQRPAHTALLGRPALFAFRLLRGGTIGWIAGVGAAGAVIGLVAKAAGHAAAKSNALAETLRRLGARSVGAAAYLGVAFVIITATIALQAAGLVTASRDEELDGHLDNLLVRPVRRLGWLAGRLAVAAGAVAVVSVAAGVAAWAGTASQHTAISGTRVVEAGLNALPAALLVLGIGTLALGVAPRHAGAVAYGAVAWSFLIELIGAAIRANHWLLDTSILHHLAAVPAADPRWGAGAGMVAMAVLAAAGGAVAFTRRDILGAG